MFLRFERDSRDPPRNPCTQPLEASDCPLGSLRSITQILIACHVHAVDQFLFFFIKALGITMNDDEYKYCIKKVLKKIKLS